MLRVTLLAAAIAATAPAAFANECEQNFTKSGSPFSGTDFTSSVTVADLSAADALAQMRGIMIAEGLDVVSQDNETGALLAEQPARGTSRPVPVLINVFDESGAAGVELTIKTEKGQMAKADTMRTYVCQLLAKVQGGDAGRAAAAAGAQQQNRDDLTEKDVYVFSREIAREAQNNAVAVNARHQGRRYTLKGRVDYIQEDGEDYNVSFEIPEMRDVAFQVGREPPRVGVACLFRPNQVANVLTFRKGDSVRFTGAFLRYDDFKRMVWLQNCRQTRR